MPDRSSADRRPWLCALRHLPGPRDRLRHLRARPRGLRAGERAEVAKNYDLAVVEYTKAAARQPRRHRRAAGARAREAARRAGTRVPRAARSPAPSATKRRSVEYQIASELNPSDALVDEALRDTRQKLRTKIAVTRNGKTELESLIERSRDLPPPGLDLPADAKLPDSLVFSSASSRNVFRSIAQFAGLNVVFDPAFRDETDQRRPAQA